MGASGSGRDTRVRLITRVESATVQPGEVTRLFGIEPTSTASPGQPRAGTGGPLHTMFVWRHATQLEAELRHEKGVVTLLERMLDRLEPARPAWHPLVCSGEMTLLFACDVRLAPDRRPGLHFDQVLVRRIAAIGASLDVLVLPDLEEGRS